MCQFRFPQPPSSTTGLSKRNDDESVTNDASKTLAKVHKLLVDGNTDVSLSELLTLANVESSDYCHALSTSSRGNTVVLKQDPCDSNISNYNATVMIAWQANMDIQYVMNAYACVMYVASYIMKNEQSMGELLKQKQQLHNYVK